LTVEAKCRISTKDDSNLLHAVALAKKGKLNDIPWSKGDELDLIVHNDENIKIYALPGAQVEITNKGEHTLKAICTS